MRALLHIGWMLVLTTLFGVVAGCSGTMRPLYTEQAIPGVVSQMNESLRQLPEPEERVVATVYRFRDQTGQYKASDRIASWSTAVTQGATSILLKSLEDSGWFTTIERESISNLLNERQIIQSIRQQHSGAQTGALPPLLFAGIILEGGIIGYDTNILTGGLGARYLGVGASTQYRKDQVTIYLRAVSTQSGRILKTVHATKSVLSVKLDGGVFKFIDTKRLLEAEAGYTYNEPTVMAVTEAIDLAVKMLIVEGIDEGLWAARDPEQMSEYRQALARQEHLIMERERDYFGLVSHTDLRSGWWFSTNAAVGRVVGNYDNSHTNAGLVLQLERGLGLSGFSLSTDLLRMQMSAPGIYSRWLNGVDVKANVYLLPRYRFSPFVSAGAGVFVFDQVFDQRFERMQEEVFPYVSMAGGMDYRFGNWVGLRMGATYRYLLKDGLDGVVLGKYNDQHWSVYAGIVLRTGF